MQPHNLLLVSRQMERKESVRRPFPGNSSPPTELEEAASAGSGFYSKHDHCGGGGLGGGRTVVWMGFG